MSQQKPSQNGSSTTTSSSNNAPIQKENNIPGQATYSIWRSDFEIDAKYVVVAGVQPIKAIGKGAYGIVCSAKVTPTGEKVAIKKIQNAFENETDARRTLRECTLLRQLKHENVIALKDIMKPHSSGRESFKDVYLVYELMDTDLHQIIRSKQPLSDDHFQYFVYQILRGLKYVHSANVLHRDLKPSNLLLNATCDLKICDFGLARTREVSPFMTEYVVTRWYRAPELLLNSENYTPAIDMWSVGCIIAEMLGRKPIFPGKDYVDQLRLIVQTLGVPSEDDMAYIKSDKAKEFIRHTMQNRKRVNFRRVFPDANQLAIDLMEKMLQFDPSKRITVEQALQHPYMQQLHDSANEPVCLQPIQLGFEEEELNGDQVRERIYREITTYYHP